MTAMRFAETIAAVSETSEEKHRRRTQIARDWFLACDRILPADVAPHEFLAILIGEIENATLEGAALVCEGWPDTNWRHDGTLKLRLDGALESARRIRARKDAP